MNNHLEALALRLRDDPFFLACPLAHYADSEAMDDTKLATALGCSLDDLVHVRLCRAPDASRFTEDIERIASRFKLNPDVLAQVVRGGQVIFHLQQISSSNQGTLLAARDDDMPDTNGRKEDGS
jgi:hypothetical protein